MKTYKIGISSMNISVISNIEGFYCESTYKYRNVPSHCINLSGIIRFREILEERITLCIVTPTGKLT